MFKQAFRLKRKNGYSWRNYDLISFNTFVTIHVVRKTKSQQVKFKYKYILFKRPVSTMIVLNVQKLEEKRGKLYKKTVACNQRNVYFYFSAPFT